MIVCITDLLLVTLFDDRVDNHPVFPGTSRILASLSYVPA